MMRAIAIAITVVAFGVAAQVSPVCAASGVEKATMLCELIKREDGNTQASKLLGSLMTAALVGNGISAVVYAFEANGAVSVVIEVDGLDEVVGGDLIRFRLITEEQHNELTAKGILSENSLIFWRATGSVIPRVVVGRGTSYTFY